MYLTESRKSQKQPRAPQSVTRSKRTFCLPKGTPLQTQYLSSLEGLNISKYIRSH